MALVAGSLNADGTFVSADCMAAFIDDALPSKPEFGQRERRELLIAIAAGVIGYLRKHEADFSISVTGVHSGSHQASLKLL